MGSSYNLGRIRGSSAGGALNLSFSEERGKYGCVVERRFMFEKVMNVVFFVLISVIEKNCIRRICLISVYIYIFLFKNKIISCAKKYYTYVRKL